MRTVLWIAGGTLCVAAGLVGVFVPLLPTTPFLLLAAILYARGSRRWYRWLLGNRWFGGYVRRYQERRSMTRSHKAISVGLLWAALAASAAFGGTEWWARGVLAIVGIGVTTHVLRLGTE